MVSVGQRDPLVEEIFFFSFSKMARNLLLAFFLFFVSSEALVRHGMNMQFASSTLKVQRAQIEKQLKHKISQYAALSKEIPDARAQVFFFL